MASSHQLTLPITVKQHQNYWHLLRINACFKRLFPKRAKQLLGPLEKYKPNKAFVTWAQSSSLFCVQNSFFSWTYLVMWYLSRIDWVFPQCDDFALPRIKQWSKNIPLSDAQDILDYTRSWFYLVYYFKREDVNYKCITETLNLIQYFEHWDTIFFKYVPLTKVTFTQQNFFFSTELLWRHNQKKRRSCSF